MRILCAVLVMGAALLTAPPAFGLANRVFLSAAHGNDANACDNIQTPCQTFQGAITQLNPNGEAIVLDSGGYGPLNITQGVTIEAPPGVLAFIHPPSGDAVTVNAPGQVVVLRGLTLNTGASFGVNVQAVSILHIENCVINDFSIGIIVNGATNPVLLVSDTIIRSCFQGALLLTNSGGVEFVADSVRIEKSGQNGVWASNNATAILWKAVVSANATGLKAAPLSGSASIMSGSCLLTGNTVSGVLADSNGTARVSNSIVTDNLVGLQAINAGVCASRSDNSIEGNGTDTSGTTTYAAK